MLKNNIPLTDTVKQLNVHKRQHKNKLKVFGVLYTCFISSSNNNLILKK